MNASMSAGRGIVRWLGAAAALAAAAAPAWGGGPPERIYDVSDVQGTSVYWTGPDAQGPGEYWYVATAFDVGVQTSITRLARYRYEGATAGSPPDTTITFEVYDDASGNVGDQVFSRSGLPGQNGVALMDLDPSGPGPADGRDDLVLDLGVGELTLEPGRYWLSVFTAATGIEYAYTNIVPPMHGAPGTPDPPLDVAFRWAQAGVTEWTHAKFPGGLKVAVRVEGVLGPPTATFTLTNVGPPQCFRGADPPTMRRIPIEIAVRDVNAVVSQGLAMFYTNLRLQALDGGAYNEPATSHLLAFTPQTAADLTELQSTGMPKDAPYGNGEDLLSLGATQHPADLTPVLGIGQAGDTPRVLIDGELQLPSAGGVYRIRLEGTRALVYRTGDVSVAPNVDPAVVQLNGFVPVNGSEIEVKVINPIGDCDADGCIDGVDYIHFTDCFSGSSDGTGFEPPSAECLCCFDFDSDGDVDANDLIQFQLVFGVGCP